MYSLSAEYDEIEVIPDPVWIGASICWAIATFCGFSKKRYAIEDFVPRAQDHSARVPVDPKKAEARARATIAFNEARRSYQGKEYNEAAIMANARKHA